MHLRVLLIIFFIWIQFEPFALVLFRAAMAVGVLVLEGLLIERVGNLVVLSHFALNTRILFRIRLSLWNFLLLLCDGAHSDTLKCEFPAFLNLLIGLFLLSRKGLEKNRAKPYWVSLNLSLRFLLRCHFCIFCLWLRRQFRLHELFTPWEHVWDPFLLKALQKCVHQLLSFQSFSLILFFLD